MTVQMRQIDRRTRGDLRAIEGSVYRAEARAAWGRVRVLGERVHLAVVADRPELADQSAGAIVSIANRRLRQLGEGPEAA